MVNIENSCCFTGHRSDKFEFSLTEPTMEYSKFYARLSCAVADALEKGVTTFYCGLAHGFDIIAGEYISVVKLKRDDVKLIGVVPYSGQEKGWSQDWQARYRALLNECDEVVTLNDAYAKWVFDQRNHYMVDRCRYVIAYYDGSKGGTDNTVKYAVKHCRDVFNIYTTHPNQEFISCLRTIGYLIPPEE